eukprot:15382538-Heterocapsa_arctica.AAC.1
MRLFIAVVPLSLLAFSRQQLRARLGSPALGLPVLTFTFSRSTAVRPAPTRTTRDRMAPRP